MTLSCHTNTTLSSGGLHRYKVRPSRTIQRARSRQFPPLDISLVDHLIETLPIGFAYVDSAMTIVEANCLFGTSCQSHLESLSGVSLASIISETIWPNFSRAFRGALESRVESTTQSTQVLDGSETVDSNLTFSFYPVSEFGKVVGVGIAAATDTALTESMRNISSEAETFKIPATRAFLAEMLAALTEGKLVLCSGECDLPSRRAELTPSIPLSLEALSMVRHQVMAAAKYLEFDEIHASDFVLGVGEALANALVHAKHGCAEVTVDPDKSVLQVRVSDVGEGIAETLIHRAALERGYTTAGTLGHGFFLMLNTCDKVWLMTSPAGTTVVMEQYRAK